MVSKSFKARLVSPFIFLGLIYLFLQPNSFFLDLNLFIWSFSRSFSSAPTHSFQFIIHQLISTNFSAVKHYWRRMLCRGPLALGKGPETLSKGFAEGPLSGTQQSLCRGPGRPSAKKRSRQAPVPLAVSLPRADPRQRNVFFICLPRADPRQINFFIFLKKPLPRASSLALGKEIFRIF